MSEHHFKKQKQADNCETHDCPPYDPIKNFYMEPTGCYVLIRVNISEKLIELAICNKDHVIEQVFRGKKSQDIYHAVFQYEKKNNVVWFESKQHMAYLGKELKKAEISLQTHSEYIQE